MLEERAITQTEKFEASNQIPLSLHGSVDYVWTTVFIFYKFLLPHIQNNSAAVKVCYTFYW